MAAYTREIAGTELRRRVDRLPRVRLAHLPTPLEELPRLSEALGGPRIFIKRDDCTGLAFGGNKTRHNEFILGLAQKRGADIVVWGAGVQSNNCRQTAAACAKLGIPCHLVLTTSNHAAEVQGNLLLDYVVGATVEFVDAPMGNELRSAVGQAADRFRQRGKIVFGGDDPAVRPSGAVSYALAVAELTEQLAERGLSPEAIYFCSSGTTGAGMFLGKALLGMASTMHAIMPIEWPWDTRSSMAEIGNLASELLSCQPCLDPGDIDATADFIGAGYGQATTDGMEAIRLVAQTEGILLDPVYTAKAMAALVADVRSRKLRRGQDVVFIHTGGTPALFAYQHELIKEFVAP